MDILEFMKRRADLQSLMMSVGTVLAGTAATVIRGNMEVLPASICILFAVVLQLGGNLYHYYCFLKRNVTAKPTQRIPSNRIQANETAIRILRESSKACLLVSLMLGLTIMTMTNRVWWALIVGVTLYGLIYLMAKSPLIYRSPLSLIVTFLTFGPIGVMSTAFLQYQYEATQSMLSFFDSAPSIFLGPAMGFLACSHHITLSYFSNRIEPSTKNPKMVQKLGLRFSEVLIGINGLLSFALLVVMAFLLEFPKPMIALVPGFIAFCLNTYVAARLHNAGVGELRFLTTLTRVNFLLTGLACFILWWIIGAPNDSLRVIFPTA